MKRILLAWSILVLATAAGQAQSNDFVTIAPEPGFHAWWLRAQFHPFETQVRGIPIGRIHASWCKATEFRKELFPPELAKDIETNRASFSTAGDFDGSKVRQTALIGAYETCGGEHGSFLLILARPPGQAPVVRFVQEFRELQFGVVEALPNSTLAVFHCMECDHVTRFKWDRPKRRFVRFTLPDED